MDVGMKTVLRTSLLHPKNFKRAVKFNQINGFKTDCVFKSVLCCNAGCYLIPKILFKTFENTDVYISQTLLI